MPVDDERVFRGLLNVEVLTVTLSANAIGETA